MTHIYTISVEINTAKLLGEVATLENSVNGFMANMGFTEKMVLRSTFPLTLTTNRELTIEEKGKITEVTEAQFGEGAKVVSFVKNI